MGPKPLEAWLISPLRCSFCSFFNKPEDSASLGLAQLSLQVFFSVLFSGNPGPVPLLAWYTSSFICSFCSFLNILVFAMAKTSDFFFVSFPRTETHKGGSSFSLVQISRLVMFHSLPLHGLHLARPPCPSPVPGVYSNSCPLSRWCHPTLLSFVIPFPPASIFPSISVFSNESVLRIRWPKY